MRLKAVYDTQDDVPEAARDFYIEKNGKWHLDVEGVNEHADVATLKNAYERVKADKKKATDDLKALQDKFASVPEDFNADEWSRLKALDIDENDPKVKEKREEHVQGLKKIHEQRIAAMERTHAEALAKKDAEIQSRDAAIATIKVDEGLTKALTAAGVTKPSMLAGAKALLKSSVKVINEDGSYRAVVETDLGEEEIEKFVSKWTGGDVGKDFVTHQDGGDDGKGGTKQQRAGGAGNPYAAGSWNKSEQAKLYRDKPLEAERLAKQAGFRDVNETFAASGPKPKPA